MSTDTQIGKSGQDDTSGIKPQQDEIDIPQKINYLEKRADDIEANFHKLEKDIHGFKTLAYFIIGAMAVAFAFTSILIGLDYFKYNQDRYEKFIDKTEEIKNNFYSKEDLKNLIDENNKNKQVLDCIKIKGYFTIQCLINNK